MAPVNGVDEPELGLPDGDIVQHQPHCYNN